MVVDVGQLVLRPFVFDGVPAFPPHSADASFFELRGLACPS